MQRDQFFSSKIRPSETEQPLAKKQKHEFVSKESAEKKAATILAEKKFTAFNSLFRKTLDDKPSIEALHNYRDMLIKLGMEIIHFEINRFTSKDTADIIASYLPSLTPPEDFPTALVRHAISLNKEYCSDIPETINMNEPVLVEPHRSHPFTKCDIDLAGSGYDKSLSLSFVCKPDRTGIYGESLSNYVENTILLTEKQFHKIVSVFEAYYPDSIRYVT